MHREMCSVLLFDETKKIRDVTDVNGKIIFAFMSEIVTSIFSNNRNTHKLFKYDVAVTKLSDCFYCIGTNYNKNNSIS